MEKKFLKDQVKYQLKIVKKKNNIFIKNYNNKEVN